MLDKAKTKANANERIPYEAPAMKARRLHVAVDGIKPLLTHNPESMNTPSEPGKGSRIPDAEVEAEAGVYRMANGVCALKGEAFRGAALGAASAWKKKRLSMKSLLSHITVVEELVPLRRRDGTAIKDYVIDARRAIVQKQGIVRRRPRFDEWSCEFTIEFDPALVDEPRLIVDILADAGNRIGVGDYRPSRNGWFGRFAVREYWLD
jgi:hypothetical protein